MIRLNSDLIERLMWKDTYYLDESTSGTYNAGYLSDAVLSLRKNTSERKQGIAREYQEKVRNSGEVPLLPLTISIVKELPVSKSGRGLKPSAGTLSAKFKACEQSPYKQHKPYQVRTSLWELAPLFYYGTPAISQEDGRVGKDNGDLLIIRTSDWRKLDVYVFKGLGAVEYMNDVLEYLQREQ